MFSELPAHIRAWSLFLEIYCMAAQAQSYQTKLEVLSAMSLR